MLFPRAADVPFSKPLEARTTQGDLEVERSGEGDLGRKHSSTPSCVEDKGACEVQRCRGSACRGVVSSDHRVSF